MVALLTLLSLATFDDATQIETVAGGKVNRASILGRWAAKLNLDFHKGYAKGKQFKTKLYQSNEIRKQWPFGGMLKLIITKPHISCKFMFFFTKTFTLEVVQKWQTPIRSSNECYYHRFHDCQ